MVEAKTQKKRTHGEAEPSQVLQQKKLETETIEKADKKADQIQSEQKEESDAAEASSASGEEASASGEPASKKSRVVFPHDVPNDIIQKIKSGPLSIDEMRSILDTYGRSEKDFKAGDVIRVADRMQQDYEYKLSMAAGDLSDYPDFKPFSTPAQILRMGVFEGHYANDALLEYPKEWFLEAAERGKLSPQKPDPSVNYAKVKSRQSLKTWQQKGWILGSDIRGWFQWYCRFWLGRRDPEIDAKQIQRWKEFSKLEGENLTGDAQKQALLQWAHDPEIPQQSS